jgi:hypothetical protein
MEVPGKCPICLSGTLVFLKVDYNPGSEEFLEILVCDNTAVIPLTNYLEIYVRIS